MRIFGFTLAVVGVVATVATLAFNALPSSINLQSIDSVEVEFQEFIARYGKSYESKEEYFKRLEIFRESKLTHAKLNSMNSMAVYGVTQFSDYTTEEFNKMLGANQIALPNELVEKLDTSVINGPIDWRQRNAVNKIKNQGGCGSCWAFSAISVVEGMHSIYRGQLHRLSEQQLVDCSRSNAGCSGGLMPGAWSDMQNMGGYMTLGDYPYSGTNG